MAYKNKEDRLNKQRYKNRKTRIDGQRIVREAKDKPCADCGGKFHFSAMDFDHVRGQKRFTIGPLKSLGCSIKRLWDEIAKCDVVCSNCHRVRTYKQRFIEQPDGTMQFNPKWLRRPQQLKTHCPQGHAYKGRNLGVSKGVRYCRMCKRLAAARKRAKQKASRDNWLRKYSNGSPRKVPFRLARDGRLILDREAH